MWTDYSLSEKIGTVIFFSIVCLAIITAVTKLCPYRRARGRSRSGSGSSTDPAVVPVVVRRYKIPASWEFVQQEVVGATAAAAAAAEPTPPQRPRLPERRHTEDDRRAALVALFFGGTRSRANAELDLESQELDTLPQHPSPQYSQFAPPEQPPSKMNR